MYCILRNCVFILFFQATLITFTFQSQMRALSEVSVQPSNCCKCAGQKFLNMRPLKLFLVIKCGSKDSCFGHLTPEMLP